MSVTVEEIARRLKEADAGEFEQLERALQADTRSGVQHALRAARKRLERQAAEADRISALYAFDYERAGGGIVVGLDEVGRGAIAGPLAVGAVALPFCPHIPSLDDSKRLSPEQRDRVARDVKEHALGWAVYYVEPALIDRDGMALSLRRAFKGALGAVEDKGVRAEVVLVDGNPLGIDARERSVVKGDAKSAAIAAASVVAKVARDALMVEADSAFSQYGFPQHKGYGTPAHAEAIRRHGLSAMHRASFCGSLLQEALF